MNSEHDDIENKPGNFFSRLKNALRGKKDSIKNNLANIIKTKKIDEEILEDIETELIFNLINLSDTRIDCFRTIFKQLAPQVVCLESACLIE